MAYIMNKSDSDFQQGGACTSRPVAFNGHLSTHGLLIGLRDKPQKKQASQLLVVVL